jgi:hypothetical protein
MSDLRVEESIGLVYENPLNSFTDARGVHNALIFAHERIHLHLRWSFRMGPRVRKGDERPLRTASRPCKGSNLARVSALWAANPQSRPASISPLQDRFAYPRSALYTCDSNCVVFVPGRLSLLLCGTMFGMRLPRSDLSAGGNAIAGKLDDFC